MKKIYSLLLTTAIGISLAACGDTTPQTPTETADSGFTLPADTENVETNPLIETALDLNETQQFSDGNHTLEIQAIRQLDKLETETYTDTPADGKVYLIAFMTISNQTDTDDYISPYQVTATLNGTEAIENSYLVNDPEEGYTTIFDTIEALDRRNGFIVWEVPRDWTSLDVVWDNWKETNNTELTIHITPELLFDHMDN